MDAIHIDHLAKALAASSARRGLFSLLAALPLLGGLAAWLGEEHVEAKGRRRRRKKRHKHGQPRRHGRRKQRKCKTKSRARTCAGRCGIVTGNCKKTVDCGPCACDPSCGACLRCNEATSICEADPSQQGMACGEAGQVCHAGGSCACDAASCPACATCQRDGRCTTPCNGSGCCDSTETCQPGTSIGACGRNGGTCDICTGQEQCRNQTCVCTPDCAEKCGGASDGCGGTCTTCEAGKICAGQTCVTGQGTCAAGDNFCSNPSKTCNGDGCQCRITTEGDTRCGGTAPGGGTSACGECAASSDCATLYPNVIGAFCMAGGTGCCNRTAPKGNCVAPCPD